MEFRPPLAEPRPRREESSAAVVRRRRGIEPTTLLPPAAAVRVRTAAAAATALISPGAGFIKSRPLSAPATYRAPRDQI